MLLFQGNNGERLPCPLFKSMHQQSSRRESSPQMPGGYCCEFDGELRIFAIRFCKRRALFNVRRYSPGDTYPTTLPNKSACGLNTTVQGMERTSRIFAIRFSSSKSRTTGTNDESIVSETVGCSMVFPFSLVQNRHQSALKTSKIGLPVAIDCS